MLTILENAPMSVLSQCRDDLGRPLSCVPKVRRLLFQQFIDSKSVTAVLIGDELVLVIGVYDNGSNRELWFLSGPAILHSPRAAVRAGRAIIANLSRSYSPVISLVRSDQPSGARLARLVGMVPTGEVGVNVNCPYEVYACQD